MSNPTWTEALQFAAGPGAALIAGILISVLVEYWNWFQARQQKSKVAVYVSLCIAVPLASTSLAILTGEWGSWGDIGGTWWPAAYAGLSGAGLGTLFHAYKPNSVRNGG